MTTLFPKTMLFNASLAVLTMLTVVPAGLLALSAPDTPAAAVFEAVWLLSSAVLTFSSSVNDARKAVRTKSVRLALRSLRSLAATAVLVWIWLAASPGVVVFTAAVWTLFLLVFVVAVVTKVAKRAGAHAA